ncbi:DUF397 domain-containing protein [Saccharopolyspora sp. ASAGF58]
MAFPAGWIAARDSKDPDGGVLVFDHPTSPSSSKARPGC